MAEHVCAEALGASTEAHIVNTMSAAALRYVPSESLYNTSKFALLGLSFFFITRGSSSGSTAVPMKLDLIVLPGFAESSGSLGEAWPIVRSGVGAAGDEAGRGYVYLGVI